MTRFVGMCIGLGHGSQWGDEDQVGYVLRVDADGWFSVGSHLSSSVGYAEGDVRRLFDRRPEQAEDDTYEWVGQVTSDDAAAQYPPGPEDAPMRARDGVTP